MLRSTETASRILVAEPAGMNARLPMWAPTARKAASNPPAFMLCSMCSTLVLSLSTTPISVIRLTSASSTSRGSRYLGMPKRIMPPANGPASCSSTACPSFAR